MTTHIGSTASITLITGLPGSGKSLRTVKFCKEASEAGETLFVCNLNGLKVPHIPFEDPRQWRDLPSGSVLVVDEAQQFFRTRRGGEAPEYITAMETIRHLGVRLVLVTQQPDYLDTHLRGLVGLHEHLLRVNGQQAAKIWRHNEVMDNVRSEKARSRYDVETWQYEKSLFPLYESAQVHTVKRTFSSKFKKGVVFAAAAGALGLFVAYKFTGILGGDANAQALDPVAATGSREAAGSPPRVDDLRHVSAVEKHEPQAMREFIANLQPRVPSLPWSAPIYDGRNAVAEPRVFCITSAAGIDANGQHRAGGYTCMTEQGTRVVMDERQAAAIARWGEPYNPFKQPPQVAQGGVTLEADRLGDRRTAAVAPVFAGGGAGTVGAPGVSPEFGTITRAVP